MDGQSATLRAVGPVKLDKAPLPNQILRNLRRAIADRRLVPGMRLPSEPALARQLGVSRASLREALQIMERERLLTRRPGVGTYIAPAARFQLHRGLDELFSTTELIESHGYRAGTTDVQVRRIAATPEVAAGLGVEPGVSISHLSRTRLANATPVIQCEEYLPEALLEAAGVEPEELHRMASLYVFLRDRLGLEVVAAEANIRPCAATARVGARLGVARGHPLLLLEQLHIAEDGRAVCLSYNYHNADLVHFRLARRSAR